MAIIGFLTTKSFNHIVNFNDHKRKRGGFEMKKIILMAVGATLAAGSAWAVPFGDGGAALQTVLDNITLPNPGGPSSVNVITDELADPMDSVWKIGGTGGSISTIVIELAGFAGQNTFGIYDAADSTKKVEMFAGAATTGSQALVSILANGSVIVNFVDTGIDFAGNAMGFYLNSSANAGGGVWYSDTSLNSDGVDHMAAYAGEGQTVQIPPYSPGPWLPNEWVLAWEDLDGSIADYDYTDFVVMVESISPVPEPGTLALLGTGLLGIGAVLRKKKS